MAADMDGLRKRIIFTAGLSSISAGMVWLLVSVRPADRAPVVAGGAELPPVLRIRAQDVEYLTALDDNLARVVEQVMPGVVKVYGKRESPEGKEVLLPDGKRQRRLTAEDVVGSGVIVRSDGYVVTNWHVVENVSPLKVAMHAGAMEREASLISQDEAMDLAVLKIKPLREAETFPALPMGDSDTARSGHLVMAIGNPFNLSDSITHGMIGHRDRRLSDSVTNYLQTSCVINPGNSGGPLISMRGEVIGIITRKIFGTEERGAGEGYGLAIPSNDVRDALDRMIGGNRPRPYTGISVMDWPERYYQNAAIPKAAVINGLEARSPGLKAGLQKGDVLTAVNGQLVTGAAEFRRLLRTLEVGKEASLMVTRARPDKGTGELTLTVTPEDFKVALPSRGGVPRVVRGLTVRTLSPGELSGLRIMDGMGLRVDSVAPDSPLRRVIEAGAVILNAGEQLPGEQAPGELEPVESPEKLDEILTKYAGTGGCLSLAGKAGENEFVFFPAFEN